MSAARPADTPSNLDLALDLLAAAAQLERALDDALSNVKGISFSEYQLLRALAEAPSRRATRVALARTVRRTPSGVTRALRPLEAIGVVETERDQRDARRSLASLTDAGAELVDDATSVVDDVVDTHRGLALLSPVTREALADALALLR